MSKNNNDIRSFRKMFRDQVWGITKQICKFEPLDNIVIFSDPRGGSTWITEMIMELPKSTILWEPLHLGKVEHFKKVGFGWRQFIPETEEWTEAKKAFESVFRGEVLNDWTCQMTTPLKLISSERMVVKFVRANAMIPWITKQFHFKYAPVLLLRHPFAVVASQMNYGAWDKDFERFPIPDVRYNNIYLEHAEFLSSLTTKEEELVATWCITNSVPLKSERNNIDWVTIYYEDLIMYPEKEMQRLFSVWGIDMPSSVYKAINRPSSTTKDDTFTRSTEKQLTKWKDFFDDDQKAKLQRILDYFDVDVYDAENHLPLVHHHEKLLEINDE